MDSCVRVVHSRFALLLRVCLSFPFSYRINLSGRFANFSRARKERKRGEFIAQHIARLEEERITRFMRPLMSLFVHTDSARIIPPAARINVRFLRGQIYDTILIILSRGINVPRYKVKASPRSTSLFWSGDKSRLSRLRSSCGSHRGKDVVGS